MAQPGERWIYNTGSCVLSVLIARAAGTSLSQFLQERLFEPLGMRDTGFLASAAQLDRLVDAHLPRLKQPAEGRQSPVPDLYESATNSAWKTAPAFPDGAAGLLSTADDCFAFARFILQRGQARGRHLLSEASIAAMTMDYLTPAQREDGIVVLGPGRGWGLGMAVFTADSAEGIPTGSYGWNGGFGTSWVATPSSNTTAILLTQTLYASPEPPQVHADFWRLAYS
jgi:CubicO group peptidase (beta-lactamase class C family)